MAAARAMRVTADVAFLRVPPEPGAALFVYVKEISSRFSVAVFVWLDGPPMSRSVPCRRGWLVPLRGLCAQLSSSLRASVAILPRLTQQRTLWQVLTLFSRVCGAMR